MAGRIFYVGALVGAVALCGAATGRGANPGPNVSLSVSGAPGAVSLGHYVAYTATIHNGDSNNVTHVALAAPTAGSTSPFPLTYVSVSPSAGTCSAPPGLPLSCSFGSLKSGDTITVTFVFRAPAAIPPSGAAVTFVAQTSFDEGPNDQNSSHTDTDAASASTTLGAVGSDFVTGFVPFSLGDDLETAGDLTGPSNGNPQKTGLDVPAFAAASLGATGVVQEVPHPATDTTSDCQAGFSCFGQTSFVTLPGVFSPPLELSFRFDASELPPGMTDKKLRMFHDGVLVPRCTTPGVLSPAPTCQSSTTTFDDKDLGALLLSNSNGSYRP
ncbi:MAG TPA: hypothetical protein VE596_08870 [Gaiellaceae bacterium]|jgi:hypothetical protein|nr:hypothetical protein [Gaiellaceae bacterium]